MNLKNQQGASLITSAIFIFLLVGAITFAVQVGPAYLSNMSVNKALQTIPEKLKRDSQMATSAGFVEDAKRLLFADLRINNIRDIPVEALSFTDAGDDQVTLTLDYEVRKTLFYNIDVVIHFVDSVTVKKP